MMGIEIVGNPMIHATVGGVNGHYKAIIGMGFTRVRFYERNPEYDGTYRPGCYEYRSELVASVSAGNYGSDGVRPMPNPLAGKQIADAIRRHAEKRLAGA